MTTEILLAGFGGQGVLFVFVVLWTARNFHGFPPTVLKCVAVRLTVPYVFPTNL